MHEDIEWGFDGLVTCLWHWASLVEGIDDLDRHEGASIAIDEALAVAALREAAAMSEHVAQQEQRAPAYSAEARALIDQLKRRGTWPRKEGSGGTWTDEERVAAFLLRHLYGLGDPQLMAEIGVKRQAINEQIGGKRALAHNSIVKAKSGWEPPAELLRRLRRPIGALQAVNVELIAAASKSA